MCIESEIVHRVFIVGCPRSGTTLVQGMLGMHPSVQTFPETHFFDYAFPGNFLKRRLTWPALNVRRVMQQFMLEIGRPDLAREAKISPLARDYGAKFVELLDRIALEAGKRIWVEKTPKHLYFIDAITEQVLKCKFLHIVRPGVDVVTSLYEITNRDPKTWTKGRRLGFKGFTIDECIALWNRGIEITWKHHKQPSHHVVRYESLVADPEPELKGICEFLAIDFSATMLRPEEMFAKIVGTEEPWKANNSQPIHRPESKFQQIFSEETQRYILENLVEIPF